MTRIIFAVIMSISVAFGTVQAQVEVEGAVEGQWTLEESPYCVIDDIIVRDGDELIIDPGVSVIFEDSYTFEVNGLITAVGAPDARIRFTARRAENPWLALRLLNAAEGCEFSYCIAESSQVVGEYNNQNSRGGALYAENCANLRITNCEFRQNIATGQGITTFYNCTGEFSHNYLHDNEAFTFIVWFEASPMLASHNLLEYNVCVHGAGITVQHATNLTEHNIIRYNRSTTMQWGCALYFVYQSHSVVRHNLIYGNEGGGIYIGVASLIDDFTHNVIFNNAGGPAFTLYSNSSVNIVNSISWGNDNEVWRVDNGNTAEASYSVIENYEREDVNAGEGMIDENPGFVNVGGDDFHLSPESPCINSGDPDSPPDPDESRADIGVYPYNLGEGDPEIILDPFEIVAFESGEYFLNITNDGDGLLWWRFEESADWIEFEPRRGVLRGAEDTDTFIIIDAEGMDFGEYEAEVRIESNDADMPLASTMVVLILEEPAQERDLRVRLEEGWNLISINVTPSEEFWRGEDGPDIVLMTEQLRIDGDNHHLQFMKDQNGRFYMPELGFNNIPFWQLTEGYLIKVDEDVMAEWRGTPIPADRSIFLEEGWNTVAYLPTYMLDASNPDFEVISPILEHVLMAKDSDGSFLMPEWGFSNMDPWRETRGYQIKVDGDLWFRYPPENENIEEVLQTQPRFSHWQQELKTSENMSVLFIQVDREKAANGAQIAAFSEQGRMVGVGDVVGGQCGLAVWGKNVHFKDEQGALPGENLIFRFWDGKAERKLNPQWVQGGSTYQTNELTVGKAVFFSDAPQDFELLGAFPNPFNNSVLIQYSLSENSDVKLLVFDINGKQITRLLDGFREAGFHEVTWNARGIPTGDYVLRMKAQSATRTMKVQLIH